MRFKDLPECAQLTACNLLSGIYQESKDKAAAAKEIRDAFIALYSNEEKTPAAQKPTTNITQTENPLNETIYIRNFYKDGVHIGFEYITRDGTPICGTKFNGSEIVVGKKEKSIFNKRYAEHGTVLYGALSQESEEYKNSFIYSPKQNEGKTKERHLVEIIIESDRAAVINITTTIGEDVQKTSTLIQTLPDGRPRNVSEYQREGFVDHEQLRQQLVEVSGLALKRSRG